MLEINDLSYKYSADGPMILNHLNLKIEKGEFVALVGQNGAGKTTLLKLLNGIHKPVEGDVIVAGHNTKTTKTSLMAKYIGYVFQNPDHQIFCNTVYEEMSFGLKNIGASSEAIDKKVHEMSMLLGLDALLEEQPFSLSKGQKQRVALASILALESDLLILDEPTTGQSYQECIEIMEIVKKLNAKGTTVIMVSHDMEVVLDYAQRVVILCEGGILEDGKAKDVLRNEEKLPKAGVKPPQLFEVMIALKDDFAGAVTPQQIASEVERRKAQ